MTENEMPLPNNEESNQAPLAAISEWELGITDFNKINVIPLNDAMENMKNEIAKVIVGQDETIELMMTALLVGGHVLVEGLPGIAKTLTSKLMAKCIKADFSRIQFTPDLMPTDVTGTSVFNLKENNFYFRKGPIFSNIILIDEVNRAPAKTQASLMEVMEEKQITYDGTTHKMGFPFFVIATQNPVEQEGTYALPEAQLDRFIFKIKMNYPDLNQEIAILQRFSQDFHAKQTNEVQSVIDSAQLQSFHDIIERVYIRPELLQYIASVVNNTRNNGDLFMGASPRASLAIMKAAKALAAVRRRNFVTPDDIRTVAIPALNHRLVMSHEREMEGHTIEEIIDNILKTVEVPR